MGGIRTAGDLVARMQITRGMRLTEAKDHVAGRLAVSLADLSDPIVMLDLRKELGLGAALEGGEIAGIGDAVGLEAKFHIAALLDIPIASVRRFRAITAPREMPPR